MVAVTTEPTFMAVSGMEAELMVGAAASTLLTVTPLPVRSPISTDAAAPAAQSSAAARL